MSLFLKLKLIENLNGEVNLDKKIKFNELKRLYFCNSDKLINKVFVINKTPHEWQGIGMVECNSNPKKEIEVIDG